MQQCTVLQVICFVPLFVVFINPLMFTADPLHVPTPLPLTRLALIYPPTHLVHPLRAHPDGASSRGGSVRDLFTPQASGAYQSSRNMA